MTAEAKTDLPADLIGLPSLTLHDRPARRPGAAAVRGVRAADRVHGRGRRRGGRRARDAGRRDAVAGPGDPGRAARTRCPPARGQVVLADPEGTPLALLDITEQRVPARRGTRRRLIRLSGPGDRACASPSTARSGGSCCGRPRPARRFGDAPVLAYATRGPLHSRQIGQLRHVAGQLKARLLLLPLIAGPAEVVHQARGPGPRGARRRRRACRRRRWSSRCRWPPATRQAGAGPSASWRPGPWSPPPTARPT